MKNANFLSNYEIKETIGKGTFSIVKLGINKITKEKVAIKILKKRKLNHNRDKLRLEREISILKKLHHINVIKIHKIAEEPENYFIVMEYCENGELFNYIVEHQKLTEEETSYFFYQLINGLDYIHHKKIVHRDLKPENLLLSKDNVLKIVDFGLSNYFSEKSNLLSTPCGSPCYASPEMVCGNKYNGFRIDVWSCGIIIFAMVCGYLPLEDPDNEILFKKIMNCQVDYPDYLSENILDIMKKILVVNPNKRITIEEIKRHPFYLMGKNEFKKKHEILVDQVELIENDLNEDNNNNNDISLDMNDNLILDKNDELNIKKSKSSNYLKSEVKSDLNNIINENKNDFNLFHIKKQYEKFKIEKNLFKKDNINNSMKSKDNSMKNKEKLKELINKKFRINNQKRKIITDKIKIKDFYTNNYLNNKDTVEKTNNNSFNNNKEIIENINSDINNDHNYNILNSPFSEDYNIDKKKFYSNTKNNKTKVNLNLLQQLLNKEKLEQYFGEKKILMVQSPIIKNHKNKDSLSYILPSTKKKKSDILMNNLNLNYNTEYKNKNMSNINNNNIKKEINCYSNRVNNNKKENFNMDLNKNRTKSEFKLIKKNLELIKYGISNKDINELQRIYEPKTTKNKIGFNTNNVNNDINYTNNINNKNNILTSNYKNIHIKNLHILNNNNYNYNINIENVTDINNAKNNNNAIVYNNNQNSPIKSIIKDMNMNYITNNDLPNINNNNKSLKRKIIKTKNDLSNNNILIPKIALSKENNSNTSLNNNYNTSNLSKIYISAMSKKFINAHNKKVINKYKSSAASIDNINMNKKIMNKKQISERTINSYGYGYDINDSHSKNKKHNNNNIIYSIKNKNNLNQIKNYKNIFSNYKTNRDNNNKITLKKFNYANK